MSVVPVLLDSLTTYMAEETTNFSRISSVQLYTVVPTILMPLYNN